jgi:hypothetical protein
MHAIANGEQTACPSTEGGTTGCGGPAPVEAQSDEPNQDQDEPLLEVDLPPDHYLTHRPKMVRCEACQEASTFAKVFRVVIAMDHIDSDGDLGISSIAT